MHAKYREGPVKESTVESAFTRRLTDKRFKGVAIKINIMGRRSWPDRLVIGNKKLFEFVEFKRPGEGLRLGQSLIHKMLRGWGFAPRVCDNAVDARALADLFIQHSGAYKEGEDGHNQAQQAEKRERYDEAKAETRTGDTYGDRRARAHRGRG